MGRDDDIGTDTSGYDGDIGASTSGGDADDVQFKAYGETTRAEGTPASREDAEESDLPDQYEETPEDLELGNRGVPDGTSGGS
jgi:hypothetical protein